MLTRDVRLTEREITRLKDVAGRRIRDLNRSIARAEMNVRHGVKIQRGTLDRHYAERADLRSAETVLEVARQAIARQLTYAASKTEHVTRTRPGGSEDHLYRDR